MRKSERQLHLQSWKTLSDADVWDGLDILEWTSATSSHMGTRGFQEEARSTATELERCRQERSQEIGHQLGRGWGGCGGQELEQSCRPMCLWRCMNQEPGLFRIKERRKNQCRNWLSKYHLEIWLFKWPCACVGYIKSTEIYLKASHSVPRLLATCEHLPQCDAEWPHIRCRRKLEEIHTLWSTPAHIISFT